MWKHTFYISFILIYLGCSSSLTEESQTQAILFDTLIHAGDQYDYSIQGKYYPIRNPRNTENEFTNVGKDYEAIFEVTQYNGDDEIEFRSEPLQKEFFSSNLPRKFLKDGFLTQPQIVEIDKSHDKILFETSVKISETSVEKKLLFYVMVSGKLRHYTE